MCFVYFKATNYKIDKLQKTIISLSISIIVATIINTLLIQYISGLIIFPITYFLYSLILSYITKYKIGFSTMVTLLSYIISYILYGVSIVFTGIIFMLFGFNEIADENLLLFIPIACLTMMLLFALFRIKKFRGGFYFFKKINNDTMETVSNIIIFLSGIIIILFGFARVNFTNLDVHSNYFIGGFIIILMSLYIFIKTQSNVLYKSKMKDNTIDIQKQELEESEKIIKELQNKLSAKSKVLHDYNTRFSAYEFGIQKTMAGLGNTEFAKEIGIALEDVKTLNKDLSDKILDIEKPFNLPTTNIWSIDSLFAFLKEDCDKNNIKFNLVINDNILYLFENHIKKEKFETLISDHIKDSIIAINSGNKDYRAIMVIIGIVNNCYEIKVLDSGIEFEIDTLIKLGLEPTTTHEKAGGTGIGFMTTFETLKETKASLVIEEKEPNIDSYSKAVVIRFDGKNEYRISSYRSKKIDFRNKDKRIVILK